MPQVKSPLRYPGGKSKAIDKILPHILLNIREYREPFVGGSSVCLSVKQQFGNRMFVSEVNKIKQKYKDGRTFSVFHLRTLGI
jgi:site-specific DNA-adenine methylase